MTVYRTSLKASIIPFRLMFLTFKQTKAFRGKEKGKGPSLSIRFKSKSSKKNKYN